MSGRILPLIALLLAPLVAAAPGAAAPAGPPVRIGSTLALTGPLAATSMVHKIAGEISVEQINKRNGFLGRPIEWVLLDDQSKPEVARTLYERLITVDRAEHTKVKQNQNGRWVVVWPREFAPPGANVVYPAP